MAGSDASNFLIDSSWGSPTTGRDLDPLGSVKDCKGVGVIEREPGRRSTTSTFPAHPEDTNRYGSPPLFGLLSDI